MKTRCGRFPGRLTVEAVLADIGRPPGGVLMVEPAARIQNVRYAIRNVVSEALKLEREGREILYCNVGDPLKFDFATPPHLVEAVHRAMRDGYNGYAPSPGLIQAREAVAADAQARGLPGVTAEDVPIVTFNGLSKAYLACGWRVGWAIFSNRKLTSSLRGAALRLADARLCSPAPAQFAIQPALEGPQDHIPRMMAKLRERRAI